MHIRAYIYTHKHTHISVCVCWSSGHMSLASKQWKHSGCCCFMLPADNRILMTVCLPRAMLTTDKQWTLNLISLLLQQENKISRKKTSCIAA